MRTYSLRAAAAASAIGSIVSSLITKIILFGGGSLFLILLVTWGVTLGFGIPVSYLIHRVVQGRHAGVVLLRYVLHVLAAVLLIGAVFPGSLRFGMASLFMHTPGVLSATLYYWSYTVLLACGFGRVRSDAQ